MPDAPDYTLIYVDMIAAFSQTCTRPLHPCAQLALFKFIGLVVVERVQRDGWADYWSARPYLVRRFFSIGTRVSEAGARGSLVSQDDLVAEIDKEITAVLQALRAKNRTPLTTWCQSFR